MERYARFLGWQGGGLFIGVGGTATLTNTNVYSNQATAVCLPFSTVLELSSIAPPRKLTPRVTFHRALELTL